jgi:lipopolysaccharide/colanic/teichoic acid biosynthesis glycosyltransferase
MIKEECLRWYGAVILDSVRDKTRNEIMEFCYGHHIRVYYLPTVQDIFIQGSENMDLFNVPIMELKEYSISWENRIIKRIIDIVLSAILIVITSPIAVVRMVYGKIVYGRIIDREICLTKSKREFQLYTFANDNGNKTWIDRLPMLWDVFKGKMSMVGPKPLPYDTMEGYIKDEPRYEYRLRMKAGLTGYAQVYGRKSQSFEDLMKLDLIYILNYTIMMDFRILILSLRK